MPDAAVRASAMANMCTAGNPTSRSLTPIAKSRRTGIPDGVAPQNQAGGLGLVLGAGGFTWL